MASVCWSKLTAPAMKSVSQMLSMSGKGTASRICRRRLGAAMHTETYLVRRHAHTTRLLVAQKALSLKTGGSRQSPPVLVPQFAVLDPDDHTLECMELPDALRAP